MAAIGMPLEATPHPGGRLNFVALN